MPNGSPRSGGWSARLLAIAVGLPGRTHGPATASATSIPMMASPPRATRPRSVRLIACLRSAVAAAKAWYQAETPRGRDVLGPAEMNGRPGATGLGPDRSSQPDPGVDQAIQHVGRQVDQH